MGNFVDDSINQMTTFVNECQMFLQNCEKPNKKEYIKISTSCAIGFAIMGIIGYLIKLLFIPINTILLGN